MSSPSFLVLGALVVVSSVLSPGCVPVARNRRLTTPNQAQRLEIRAPRPVVERALADWIDDREWWLVRRDHDRTIIAVSPTESGNGMVTRERWVFRIEGTYVTVQAFLDYVKDGTWHSNQKVCSSYHYFRERQALQALSKRAAQYVQARRIRLPRATPTLEP